MANIAVNDSPEGAVLTVKGRLTIQDAAELKSSVLRMHAEEGNVHLDLSGAESLDVACIQVLCAASRSLNRARRVFRLTGGMPGGIYASLKDVGVMAQTCGSDDMEHCIWATGETDEQDNLKR